MICIPLELKNAVVYVSDSYNQDIVPTSLVGAVGKYDIHIVKLKPFEGLLCSFYDAMNGLSNSSE
jgi:hypothetical protein